MKKLLAAVAVACCTLANSGYAEQPMAEQYRAILQSGNFLVEYEADYGEYVVSKTISGYADMRMERNNLKIRGIVPLYGYGKRSYPDTLYREGKYYKFEAKKKATVADETRLDDPNLDPKDGWNTVRYALALPDEFLPICAEDYFRPDSAALGQAVYTDTGKRTIAKREYVSDKYVLPLKSQAGSTLAEINYYYCYGEKGLAYIEKVIVNKGREYVISRVKIKELTADVPVEAFTIPAGCKVYAAGIGDMDDLINKPALVEEY